MRMQPLFLLFTLVTFSVTGSVSGQDPLDEMYGQAVHSYFRGDIEHAEELLNEVIDAGSMDPRAYLFRGLCQSCCGPNPDFDTAARLEIEGKKVVNVGKALERIQGACRVEIEKARSRARLNSRAQLMEIQRTKYEQMQRGGNVTGGMIVPPRVGDPAPVPHALAPNDPFNAGMTKGEPKVLPGEPKTVVPGDEFGTEVPKTVMPEEPVPTPLDDDPFATKP